MKRTTIKDIARVAGVSPGAVSFALNDRPGVSDETRARIKQVAMDLGWKRSAAAAALSARRAGAFGIALQRGPGEDFTETFVMRFMAGLQEALQPMERTVVFQLVTSVQDEIETYRTWWGEGRVDGVVLLRPALGDGRAEALEEIGMPGIMMGGPQTSRIGSVCADEVTTTNLLVDHFASRGHRRIAYVTGPRARYYVTWRADAFRARARSQQMAAQVVHVDSGDEMAGMRASQRLLRGTQAPTAVLYDNELLAMGGVAACHDVGLQVGEDVAMASFEDAPALRMLRPGISALRRRSEAMGALTAEALVALSEGGEPTTQIGVLPELAVRGSSGRMRRDQSPLRAVQ
ncbi:LacI family DNA-binding transcriptional regulator [Luteococcus sp. Sow4_B9]|uniref:LacI family DNA-binding transcriptional regulator n=1 Tax=Luteococcus sp. Sow4_B9 TaxID=3438792 RepID=UPI003F96583F